MAETLDTQLELAEVYVAALFELAQKNGTVARVRSELEELARLAAVDRDFASFLVSRAVDSDRRREALERTLRGKLCDELLNTLLVLTRRDRPIHVAALLRAFVLREEAAAGQVEVTVVSAVELTPAERATIEKTAAEISGRKPVMEYVVDADILGGLILQIGDLRYDNSVRRQLEVAYRQMLERAERGLTVGTIAG